MFTPEFLALVTAYSVLVVGTTELIKRLTGLTGTASFLFSIAASFLISLSSLRQGLVEYLIISVFTALAANGIFKAVHKSRYL